MRTLQQQLTEKGLSDKPELKEKNERQFQKFKESLNDIDWADLMGCNKQTYRRAKGGAIRRNR
ncbi:hypothetical protein [Planomicrobium sp. CPCC 101079]|uniref:hypothetical protein n=1 Tax=Planomicrobium sp. CPCC 101079 TaxID=2599618 RepID=UPI0011B3CFFE|nr:hypothetical protein [Planomicrobium sp. CPCC 101079]TWT04618.1 hypothetical protein FQV28_08420 [Planomicrobium sp. CPCC 101079]